MDTVAIDNLLDSMVKIVGPDEEKIEGSGFIIRSDGYLITCHHVIYPLNELKVSYRNIIYRAKWCEELSDIETDLAVLKIDIQDAVPVTIVNPEGLSGEVVVVGFPHSKLENFPDGFDFHSQNIQKGVPVKTLSTYSIEETKYFNPWNKLPLKQSTFRSFKIDRRIDLGTSGGPAFVVNLKGVVGIVQSTNEDSAYAIRWGNMSAGLKSLGLNPKESTSSAYHLSAKELLFLVEKKAVHARYIVENILLAYVVDIFSPILFEHWDMQSEKLKLDSRNAQSAIDKLPNISVFSTNSRWCHVCEKMDNDVQVIMETTLLSCRLHIRNILTENWDDMKDYIDENMLGKKKNPNSLDGFGYGYPRPGYVWRSKDAFVTSKDRNADGLYSKDPLYFYRYYSDGLWSGLRFISVWSGYQVYKTCIDLLAKKDIPSNKLREVYEYILDDCRAEDQKSLYNIPNRKICEIISWFLRGEISTVSDIESVIQDKMELN